MAAKKAETKAPVKETGQIPEEKNSIPSLVARIDKLVDHEGSKVKAFVSVNIGDSFAIHGLRVVESDKGLFVAMPSSSYQKGGKTEYMDIFHPITGEARKELSNCVLEAYEQKLQEEQAENHAQGMEAEAPSMGQRM